MQTWTFPPLVQPTHSYRYGLDAFLLVRFAMLTAQDCLCDLGAGVGILSLLALSRKKVRRAVAIEIQPECLEPATKNAKILGVQDRFEFLTLDWRRAGDVLPSHSFDAILSNPPYRPLGSGKRNPDMAKALAKHEVCGNMQTLLQAVSYLLKPSGRFYVMYPPLRLEELIVSAAHHGLKLQRLAFVHAYAEHPARLFMAELVFANRRELRIEAPVVLYQEPDRYRPEIEAWAGPKRRL